MKVWKPDPLEYAIARWRERIKREEFDRKARAQEAAEHAWSECPLCGPMVVCGKCGNNCCNGGYGTLPDGSECDACPSAYQMQNNVLGEATHVKEGR